MKKKLILISVLAIITTILIYNLFKTNKISFLALGDGVASGMTAYNIEGYSFNDYLRDHLKGNQKLETYIRDFARKGIRIEELIIAIENNSEIEFQETKITIMQAIANANFITIAIGSDEVVANTTISKDVELINNISSQMKILIEKIRAFSSKTIVIIGLYYSPIYKNSLVDKINANYQIIANNNDCIFLNPKDLLNQTTHFSTKSSHYANYKGHEMINNKIISIVNFDSI